MKAKERTTYPHGLTPINAIKLFCMECNGVDPGGDFTPITECTAGMKCPLFELRPGSGVKRKRKPRTEAQKKQSSIALKQYHANKRTVK